MIKKRVLEGRNIHKSFKDKRGSVDALSGVSFYLDEGEILGVVGESGSGKTTLLRVVSGLEKADKGELFFCGAPYKTGSPALAGRFLQMIFQDAGMSFDPRMKMKKALMEVPGNRSFEDIYEILDAVGIDRALLEKRAGSLSGGQCQRMSIARALFSGVNILLCDEITSALDVTTQAQVVKLLIELCGKRRLSLIFVSHDLALVSGLCSRIMIMKEGVCVEEGTTQEVLNSPSNEYTKELIDSALML